MKEYHHITVSMFEYLFHFTISTSLPCRLLTRNPLLKRAISPRSAPPLPVPCTREAEIRCSRRRKQHGLRWRRSSLWKLIESSQDSGGKYNFLLNFFERFKRCQWFHFSNHVDGILLFWWSLAVKVSADLQQRADLRAAADAAARCKQEVPKFQTDIYVYKALKPVSGILLGTYLFHLVSVSFFVMLMVLFVLCLHA